MQKIVLATNNQNKLREVREIFTDFEVISQEEAGFYGEVIEDGETFAENALKKATAVSLFTNQITFADDSGICVEALNGGPGIYSARWSGAGDDANNIKMLKEMEDKTNRKAFFHCAIALVYPPALNKEPKIFEADWQGRIGNEIRGNNGFGYDKVFIPNGYDIYSSELPPEEKNHISHRYLALMQLKEYLQKYFYYASKNSINS